jgi:LPXTG-motif cell wall-anchored protein
VTKLENGAATASNDTGTSIAAILTEDGTGLDGLFSAVTFTQDDCGKTFAWTLAETGADAGFSIDRTIYRIEAVPTDNGDGTVSVACSVTPEPLTQEEFAQATNTTWAVTPHTMSFRDSYVKPTDTADAAPVDSTQDKNAGTESGSVGSQTGAPAIGSEATPDSPTGSGTDTSSGAGTNDKTADKGSASGKIKAKAGKTGSSKHVKATSSASTSAPETGDSNKAWLQGLIICVAVAAIGAGIALWRKNKR